MTDSKVILWHGKLILCNREKVRKKQKKQNNEDIYIPDVQRTLLDRKIMSFLDIGFHYIWHFHISNFCASIRGLLFGHSSH